MMILTRLLEPLRFHRGTALRNWRTRKSRGVLCQSAETERGVRLPRSVPEKNQPPAGIHLALISGSNTDRGLFLSRVAQAVTLRNATARIV